MQRYSPNDAVHDYVAAMLRADPRNPWAPVSAGIAWVIGLVRIRFGDAAARSVHVTLH